VTACTASCASLQCSFGAQQAAACISASLHSRIRHSQQRLVEDGAPEEEHVPSCSHQQRLCIVRSFCERLAWRICIRLWPIAALWQFVVQDESANRGRKDQQVRDVCMTSSVIMQRIVLSCLLLCCSRLYPQEVKGRKFRIATCFEIIARQKWQQGDQRY
jgi:hypothetical protein